MIWYAALASFIFFFGWFLKLVIFDRPPKPEVRFATFTCDLPEGGTIDVHIHYEQDPLWPSIEPVIRCWALTLTDQKPSPALYDSLNNWLGQIPIVAITRQIIFHPPALPPPTRKDPQLQKLLHNRECATELLKATGATPSRPLDLMEQEYAQKAITELYKPIGHVE